MLLTSIDMEQMRGFCLLLANLTHDKVVDYSFVKFYVRVYIYLFLASENFVC